MKKLLSIFIIVCFSLSLNSLCSAQTPEAKDRHAVIISFDGFKPDAITLLGEKLMPNFHRIIKEGSSTLNARTDPDRTVTMPNHTCMLTGRGVLGGAGHEYIDNRSADRSIHENKGSYVASVFDVAKEHGLTTGLFASKPKFQVFVNSYGVDKTGGQTSKLDVYQVTEYDDQSTINRVLEQIGQGLPNMTFVHFSGPDNAGHKHGWDLSEGAEYWSAVQKEDEYLGKILQAVEDNPSLADSTIIIVTADHGGIDDDHHDVTKIDNYRIPFIIWGKGVAGGMDLYRINTNNRQDPLGAQLPYGHSGQPIRNGDAANCAMSALGLPPVPGSTIGNPDPLKFGANANN